jgi:hypothetical protein
MKLADLVCCNARACRDERLVGRERPDAFPDEKTLSGSGTASEENVTAALDRFQNVPGERRILTIEDKFRKKVPKSVTYIYKVIHYIIHI